jgi:integrase
MITRLDARLVARLKPKSKPYYVSDATIRGLQIRVSERGDKAWSLRYRLGGRRWRYGLGDAKSISLASARQSAKNALRLVHSVPAVNPAEQKRQQREADTIASVSTLYLKHAQKAKRTWRADQRMLDTIVLKAWRHRPVNSITRRDVRDLIESVNGAVYPNRVRALVHTLFAFALDKDIVPANPVAGYKRPLKKEPSRDRVLTDEELRQFWTATAAFPLEMQAYWRVRLLTAQRGGEVASMRWADLDLQRALWLIPATHTKNKKEHLVPLSPAVLERLKALRVHADQILAARTRRKDARPRPITAVFRGAVGSRQRSEAAATFGLLDFRGHDLRRTAATNMRRAGIPREDVSAVLNHKIGGPEATAVYDRYDGAAEKKIALDTWARTLARILKSKAGATVVPFARGR